MASKLNQSVNAEVGAEKRLATQQSPSPHDDRIQLIANEVKQQGYAVIENAFSNEEIEEARAELVRISKSRAVQRHDPGTRPQKGRNTFEGLKTERIYALVNKSRVFDKFALHPDVLALNDHFLEPGYLLNSFQSINIQPGEKAQTLHYDDGYINVQRPRAPFGTAIMVAIDPYTSTNGSTVVIPKSHLWAADKSPSQSEAIPIVMPPGSIVYFFSTLWHGGGANTSGQDRVALTVQYCQPWVRQLENQMIAVEWEKLDEIPARLVDLLGYKVGAPFVGHVDGHSPRAAVGRMLQMQKRRYSEERGKRDSKLC